MLRKDHVDAVVGQNEAAGAGFRRYFRRDRAHARRQNSGHEAGPIGLYQLLFADRLAYDERRARNPTDHLGRRVRSVGAADEAIARAPGGPGLPL